MNYTITYYNERGKQQVMALPAGILADYIHLTDLIQNHGANLHMPHSRAMGGGLFELRPKGKEKASGACFIAHKLDRRLLYCIA